jgi:hypothetical protein
VSSSPAALQQALAAEHAAIYGYGLVLGQLTGDARDDGLSALDAHRARRDRLRALVIAAGGTPTEAAPAYRPEAPVQGAAAAAKVAADLERDVALAFGDLIAASTAETRTFAARSLQDIAVQQTAWQHAAPRFPGLVSDPTPTASPAPPPA